MLGEKVRVRGKNVRVRGKMVRVRGEISRVRGKMVRVMGERVMDRQERFGERSKGYWRFIRIRGVNGLGQATAMNCPCNGPFQRAHQLVEY